MDEKVKEKIGKALGKIPSGIGILTAQRGNEKQAMLASWFQQVSFEPPLLALAIKKGRPIGEIIQESKIFALNLLHTGQKNMLAHFGKGFEPGQDPFVGIKLDSSYPEIPVLKEALCFLTCTLREVHESGDHQLYLGEVIQGDMEEEGQSMVHLRRNGFHY